MFHSCITFRPPSLYLLCCRLLHAADFYRVIATSRTPYQEDAAALGVDFYQSTDDFCEASPDVVLLATSILSTDKVLASLPLHKFGQPPLFVDVLSVKVCHCGVLIWPGA